MRMVKYLPEAEGRVFFRSFFVFPDPELKEIQAMVLHGRLGTFQGNLQP